jgi:hypothetical protein
MKMENQKLYEMIADFCIKQVQENAGCCSEGTNWITDYDEVEEEFSICINDINLEAVIEAIEKREEVAEVLLDDGFDVTIYTDFSPFYKDSTK